MANVERHDFFPTCLYRFKHDFEENELDSMISHIDLNSLSEHKIAYLETVIKYIDGVLKSIQNRGWDIKNAISWKQFEAGMI